MVPTTAHDMPVFIPLLADTPSTAFWSCHFGLSQWLVTAMYASPVGSVQPSVVRAMLYALPSSCASYKQPRPCIRQRHSTPGIMHHTFFFSSSCCFSCSLMMNVRCGILYAPRDTISISFWNEGRSTRNVASRLSVSM